jgi:hypothetical protein
MNIIFKYKELKEFIERYKKRKSMSKVMLSIFEEMLVNMEAELINEQIKSGEVVLKAIKKGGGKK